MVTGRGCSPPLSDLRLPIPYVFTFIIGDRVSAQPFTPRLAEADPSRRAVIAGCCASREEELKHAGCLFTISYFIYILSEGARSCLPCVDIDLAVVLVNIKLFRHELNFTEYYASQSLI